MITHSAHSEKLVIILTSKSVTAYALTFPQSRPFWIMPADVKDFLRILRTCYNCSELSHFAQNCTEPKKVSSEGYIQEISNINEEEDKKETEKKVKETLEIKK